ncbi:MAG: hypothetical protein KBG15_18235 [Kofleriaceae bacterium]|nr:hypothetical protein [Kofleriaceae bacterium]
MAGIRVKATIAASLLLATFGLGLRQAQAENLRGFSAVDRPYLVGADRVCTPLLVTATTATGSPQCRTLPADLVAKLSFGPGIVETGPNAKFKANINGATLTVRESDATLVTWTANDVLGKVVAVERSKFGDRIAVTYTMRSLGREVTDIVVFDLQKSGSTGPRTGPGSEPGDPNGSKTNPTGPIVAIAPTEPKLELPVSVQKIVTYTRTRNGKAAVKGWLIVLSAAPNLAEARFGAAKALAQTKNLADAVYHLEQLQKSTANDAVEWLVAARFDSAFAKLRGDAKFRAAVGLDRKAAMPYERVMGFGGAWEQTGTSCDTPTVALKLTQERNFNLSVRSACEGMVSNSKYKGTWQVTGGSKPVVRLVLPNKGRDAEIITCEFVAKGDEEALQCPLDEDLVLTVLPVRR